MINIYRMRINGYRKNYICDENYLDDLIDDLTIQLKVKKKEIKIELVEAFKKLERIKICTKCSNIDEDEICIFCNNTKIIQSY